VPAEEFGRFSGLLLPALLLGLNLAHPDRDLGRPQLDEGDGVQDRFTDRDHGEASPYRRRRDRRAGGALELERLHHERELGDVLGGEFVELEVLQEVYAVDHQCDLVQRQRDQLVRIGVDLDRRGVGASRIGSLDQEFRGLNADAGIAFAVASGVGIPQLAPAGVNDNRVARLEGEVLLLDRAFEVLDGIS